MKRLENVVNRASSDGQRIPSPSSTGNLMPRIIRGWVLSVKHIAKIIFSFQNHIDINWLKEINISIRTD